MTFEDYWREFSRCCPLDITDSEMAKHAFETGIQEGIKRKREWVGLTREEQGDLRQAAEMALEALEEFCEMQTMLRPIERRDALRQALGQPEREWVGLTQEELQDLCVKSYHTDNAGETHFNRGYFADAIEAKLKEKNT